MDFFDSQDQARRRSGRLLFFYLVAVVLIVASVYFVVLFAADFAGLTGERVQLLWEPTIFLWTTIGTLTIIALGSTYRVLQLRAGGSRVAELMGGRRVDRATSDSDERRLINVVEEMAIASGVPVPEIFVLDREEGINAFAAGYSPTDAAVAVTAGTLRILTRDELQGVIAHEFSHILNGDMRLNIRLIGVLNGILVLHLMGLILVRSLAFSRSGTSRDRREGGGGGALVAIIIVGISLMIIGYIGVLFSRMIQAAVSRQREFLADAAAVQFTRNPDGIADALKKIGGATFGSRIRDPHATEASHLFFANGLSSPFSNLFATHPPLTKRIKAIDPSFDGKSWIRTTAPRKAASDLKSPKHRKSSPFSPLTAPLPIDSSALIATIGTLGSAQIDRAGEILQSLPKDVAEAARDPQEAEAVIYGLLLSEREDVGKKQMQLIADRAGSTTVSRLKTLLPQVQELSEELRLPLLDLSLPSLKQRSANQYRELIETIKELSNCDDEFSIFEFALVKVLQRNLEHHFQEKKSRPLIQYYAAPGLSAEISALLSALAHCSDTEPQRAFGAGKMHLPDLPLQLIPEKTSSLKAVDAALEKFEIASFPVKRQFLTAALAVIASDGVINVSEAELFRAIAASLDCPMPPIARPTAV